MSETIPFTYAEDATVLNVPDKAHPDDAAYDLCAAEGVSIAPGERKLVATGLRLAIPEGHAGLVLPRSGLAANHGITILNAPGLIDPGYRGEIFVPLVNLNFDFRWDASMAVCSIGKPYTVEKGDRIAQLLIVKTADARLVYTDPDYFNIQATTRGEGGFGSSGR